MEEKCTAKITDVKKIYEEYRKMEEWCTPQMEEEIDYAMYRQEGLNIPMWEQDFAYRLVKLN